MRERKEKNRSSKRGSKGASHAFYVYCIGERDAFGKIFEGDLPDAIEPEAQLEMIDAVGLAAVASQVPLADYDEQHLQARLSDATWTAVRALRHEEVVEHFASRASAIPLRFGAIYFDRERIGAMLSQRARRLRSIIDRLRDKEEWALTVYRDQAALLEAIVSLSQKLSALDERAASATAGQAYLLRKQIEAMKADEARAETRRVVSIIQRELAKASDEHATLSMRRSETSAHGEVVAKFVFLIARSRFDEFRRSGERLAAEHSASGFRLELTGPWPAYNFSTDGD